MSRQDFLTGKNNSPLKDPELIPKQIWDSMDEHDFGVGKVKYSILTLFINPGTKNWICRIVNHQSDVAMQSGGIPIEMSAKQIKKGFQFLRLYRPPTSDGTIWVQGQGIGFGGNYGGVVVTNSPLTTPYNNAIPYNAGVFTEGSSDNTNTAIAQSSHGVMAAVSIKNQPRSDDYTRLPTRADLASVRAGLNNEPI